MAGAAVPAAVALPWTWSDSLARLLGISSRARRAWLAVYLGLTPFLALACALGHVFVAAGAAVRDWSAAGAAAALAIAAALALLPAWMLNVRARRRARVLVEGPEEV